MAQKTGVFPVYENQFQVNKGTAGVESLVDIAAWNHSQYHLIMVLKNGNHLTKKVGHAV